MVKLRSHLARRVLSLGAGVIVIVAGAIALTVTSGGASRAPRADVADASQIPSYCDGSLPGFTLSQCEATHEQMQTQATQLWPAQGSVMSAAAAAAAGSTSGAKDITGQVVTVTATNEYETTYADAGKLMEATDPFVAPTTPVWIVTKEWSGPIMTRTEVGLHAPPANWTPPTVSTVIIDAISGNPIDSCLGCDIVQPGGRVIADATNKP